MRSAQKKKRLKAWWGKLKSASGDDSGDDQSASGDHRPWWHNSLWQDVPLKKKLGCARGTISITENAGDSVFGFISAHSSEMRQWAYDTVWWEPSCLPMLASGGGLGDPRLRRLPHWIWRAKNHFHFPTMDDCSEENASANYDMMTNMLLAPTLGPTASGVTHFRARRLVVGLAEHFVEYGRPWTAREIYKEWLCHDVILQKIQPRGQKNPYHCQGDSTAAGSGTRRPPQPEAEAHTTPWQCGCGL